MDGFTPLEAVGALVTGPVVVVGVYKHERDRISRLRARRDSLLRPADPFPRLPVGHADALAAREADGVHGPDCERFASGRSQLRRNADGATEDKAASVGWETAKASRVNSPHATAFGLVHRCRLVDAQTFKSHTIFFGEIVELNVRVDCIGENGGPSVAKLDPLLFSLPDLSYFKIIGEKSAAQFEVYKTLGK